MESYTGQLMIVGFNFAPPNWAICNGQLLPINQYTALFSLIGAQYGGDGRSTFALPDLRGRVPVGISPTYLWGHMGGSETTVLSTGQLPAHDHSPQMQVTDTNGTHPTPVLGDSLGIVGVSEGRSFTTQDAYVDVDPGIPLSGNTITSQMVGGGQPVNLMQPYVVMNYIMCLNGVYPPRQ